ncbi:hypothetical protein L6R53_22925 [Myxococcota bacterium]|nr:hypothetical protein [Myxococcota bacterium]
MGGQLAVLGAGQLEQQGRGVGPAGDGQVCFDVRYYLGLKNVNDDPYSPEKEFNRGWSLGLGYAMPF